MQLTAMDDKLGMEVEHRRGVPAARTNLWVARMAVDRFKTAKSSEPTDPYEVMLYYGSFFVFVRSALEAIGKSDGIENPELNELQAKYFRNKIERDPVFKLLKTERDKIGHGEDSWAHHPLKPISMLKRFADAGHGWSAAVFDEFWPDAPFTGEAIDVVLEQVHRRVSAWVDEIDALDQRRHERKYSD